MSAKRVWTKWNMMRIVGIRESKPMVSREVEDGYSVDTRGRAKIRTDSLVSTMTIELELPQMSKM